MKRKKFPQGDSPWILLGFVLSFPIAIYGLVSIAGRMVRPPPSCEVCRKVRETKSALKEGELTRLQALDKELDLLSSEYYERRLSILGERKQLVESEDASPAELVATKLDMARARFALGRLNEFGFRDERAVLLSAYGKWLDQRLAAGQIDGAEIRLLLDRMELR